MRTLFGVVMRIYFREVTVVDAPGRDAGGRLFAANHWNGIVDPLVILASSDYYASPIAKSTLFQIPIFRSLLALAEAVPVMRRQDAPEKASGDNDAIFERAAAHLAARGNLLIFPEGVSHNEAGVLPLKSGAARMLARAHDEGARGLTLQAVALDFDARDTFRSRALVTYGPVHEVDAIAQAGEGEALVRALTERVAEDLHRLVLEGESHGELLLIRCVAELLSDAPGETTLAERDELARAVIARGRALGADDPRYREVADAVRGYQRALDATHLTDRQVVHAAGFDLYRVVRGLWLMLLLPPSLVGALLYFLPYRLPRLATRLARGETDVVSTYKLGIGLVAFPLWATGLTVAAALLTTGALRLELIAAILLSPLCALAWIDRLDDRRGLRLLASASAAGRSRLVRLRALRGRAIDAVRAARDP